MSRYYRETVQNLNSRPGGSQPYLLRERWKICLIIGEKGCERNPSCEFKIGEEEKRAVLETLSYIGS